MLAVSANAKSASVLTQIGLNADLEYLDLTYTDQCENLGESR
jgi:hypothetical protein